MQSKLINFLKDMVEERMSSIIIIALCAVVAVGAILITHKTNNEVTEIAEEVIEYEVHNLNLPAEPLKVDPQGQK